MPQWGVFRFEGHESYARMATTVGPNTKMAPAVESRGLYDANNFGGIRTAHPPRREGTQGQTMFQS